MSVSPASTVIVAPNPAGGVGSWQNANATSVGLGAATGANTYGLWTAIPLPSGLAVGDTVMVQAQVTFTGIPSYAYGFLGLSLQYSDSVQTTYTGGWNYTPLRIGDLPASGTWGGALTPMANKCSCTLLFTVRSLTGQSLNLLVSNATNTAFTNSTQATLSVGDLNIVRINQNSSGSKII